MAVAVAPPPKSLPLDERKDFTSTWQQFFTNWWNALRAPANAFAPPATSKAAIFGGGVLTWDQNFLYVSTGQNSWKRIPLQNF